MTVGGVIALLTKYISNEYSLLMSPNIYSIEIENNHIHMIVYAERRTDG